MDTPYIKKISLIIICSMAFILWLLYLYQGHCDKELEKYKENMKEKPAVEMVNDEKFTEQNLMLESLFYEAEKNAKNAWTVNLNHRFANAIIDEENKTISFSDNPFLVGIINKKKYVLLSAIYLKGGFTACEIDKTRPSEIQDRFGKPTEKEYEIKYMYKKNNNEISFLFSSGGVLKNIVVNFN